MRLPLLIESGRYTQKRYYCKMMAFINIIYRITHWETWNWRIKYVPLVPFWIWHCIRSRSVWFFTPSNPSLAFGGFEGETKKVIYEHLPPGVYPKTIVVSAECAFAAALHLVDEKFPYPFIVKPAIGRMGYMFRVINTPAQFKLYHEKMPADYLVQEFISYPLEVSVFYYRFPDNVKGVITGFIRKEFLEVVGNGTSTLLQLMMNYKRIRFRLEEMKAKHADKLNAIIPKGEAFQLSYALNLSRGGKLASLAQHIDERLLAVFDALSHYSKTFFYGRYDIKCASIEDLKQGKNYSILEYNGCGAEPHHVYGNGYTLLQACKMLAWHWDILYQISKRNNAKGYPYWSFYRGWKLMRWCRKYFADLKKLDTEFPVF